MSLRKAINAKCKECIYDSSSGGGTWRQQTEACTSYNCPLYTVRPVSRPKLTEDEKTAKMAAPLGEMKDDAAG